MSKAINPLTQTETGQITLPQTFAYEFFQNNRYTISEKGCYEALCNNGWIKLYTKLCRVYWHTQNQFSHEVHDWKFHVSVKHQDLRRAWNLVADIFVKMNCRAGMKVAYLKESTPQKGREITIYIVKYDPKFDQSQFAGEFGLDISIEHSQEYWFQMCKKIQETLCYQGIESNGLAEGDYKLGRYISLRNEAFVKNEIGESIYPPNSSGWNPLKYEVPLNLNRFRTIEFNPNPQDPPSSPSKIYLFALVLTITIGVAMMKTKLLK